MFVIKRFIGLASIFLTLSSSGVFADVPFFSTREGMTLTMFNYDARGRKTPRDIRARVTNVVGSGDNMTVAYSVQVATKPERNGEYMVNIVNGAVQYDATWFRRNDFAAEGNGALIPANMRPGMRLADARAIFRSRNRAGNPTSERARLSITNHRCVARETITVPAGTFETYKVTYSTSGSINVIIDFDVNGTGEIWYARGIGIVKMINYDANGRVQGRSELQSIVM